MRKANYREGDWFAVPLRSGGFGTGIIARVNPKGPLLGYFFGPKLADLPSLVQVVGLSARDAVLVGVFGHLGLLEGKWQILGRVDDWNRAEWPMPVFARCEELTGRTFAVFYSDDDPNRLLCEKQISAEAADGKPRDGLMGAGYVELALTKLLQ